MIVKIGDVWDRTTEFLGDNLRTVLPIAILALLIPTSIGNSLAELRATGPQGARVGLGALAFAFAILSLWAQLAIASLAIDGVGARRATERLLPAIGVWLVLGVGAALIASAVLVPTLIAFGFDFSQVRWNPTSSQPLALPPGARLTSLLSMLVLLAAFLFVIVRMSVLSGVILVERRGLGAIARAFRLTRGLTWKLIGVVILYAVVSTVAQWAAQTVFGSVLALIAGGEGAVTLAGVLTGSVLAAVQTVFTVLAAVFAAKLYVSCVARDAAGAPLSLETTS